MKSETPQPAIWRVFDAPRDLVYRAFTDPDHLAQWWGPIGNSVPREGIDVDVRPGGYQRWTEVSANDPDLRISIDIDLTDVISGELLEGVLQVSGRLQEGIEPFTTQFRFEFHDEGEGRTRLEIRQWLSPHLTGPSQQGWVEAFNKLDATLAAESRPIVKVSWHDQADLCHQNVLGRLYRGQGRRHQLLPGGRRGVPVSHEPSASAGTFLYGRRLYESMAVWETDATLAARSDLLADFASAWQSADKVVYSTTLTAAPTAKTRIERHFDPTAVRDLKAAANADITVGGADLASQALRAGLVDECQLYILPSVLGGGKPALPTEAAVDLELIDESRFRNGVVLLRYRPVGR